MKISSAFNTSTYNPKVMLQNVTRQFDNMKNVDILSLNIKKGEFFGLLGPNGAGETTIIELSMIIKLKKIKLNEYGK